MIYAETDRRLSLNPVKAYVRVQALLVAADVSSGQPLALAADVLNRCKRINLEGVVVLRPTPGTILCEVIDTMTTAHCCAEEFKILVVNAGCTLVSSKHASRFPHRPSMADRVRQRYWNSGTMFQAPAIRSSSQANGRPDVRNRTPLI